MTKIIIATSNKGKLKEINELLSHKDVEVVSMKDAGIDIDIEENGTTFEENAEIKAKTVCEMTGSITIADDSGLEIDYFGGEPGIYSARYLGHDTPYAEKNAIILERLKDVKESERTARFVCSASAVFPNGKVVTVKETMEGRIAYEISGNGGFGYDPIFFYPPMNQTVAEMGSEEKNKISHRGKAFKALISLIDGDLK